jgi:small subunit ribosomal protein S9
MSSIDSSISDVVAVTDETPAPAAMQRRVPRGPDSAGWFWGTGRRKTAIARVRVKPGNGEFMVKKKKMADFFAEERDRNSIMAVLEKTGTAGKVDVRASVIGGGFTGQTGAIVLGLGRALLDYDSSLEPILRENGFLTRDAREVERKKYGQAGARRRFQFSKR